MKARTTFSHLLRGNVALITLCVALVFGVSYFSVRENQINQRMNALKTQAQDIASLAGILMVQERDPLLSLSTAPVRQLLGIKARALYENYAAYSLVVDRSGQVTTYFLSILEEHKELKKTFDPASIVSTLQKVLAGNEIVVQTESSDGPMFTVAVPLIYNQQFIGAVYIQTAAQTVHSAYHHMALRFTVSAMMVLIAAMLISWRFTKHLTKPLQEMAAIAGSVANGHFGAKVTPAGTEEMLELSEAFNKMSEQLEQTEQTRRDFIANVSHELGSPITNIRGFVEGMLDGTIAPDSRQKYLQIVLDEIKRIGKLVSGLLSLSRMENSGAPQYGVFDLHELIRRVVISKVNALEEKKHDLELNFDERPLFAHADKDQIEQVLINLIDNAIKYTPEDGQISVLTREEGKTIAVTVRDNGIGVLPEDAPHLFERFYMADKAHTSGKGTGLGLAICKKIIENHGQSIRLLPAQGGTAFEFTLEKGQSPHEN